MKKKKVTQTRSKQIPRRISHARVRKKARVKIARIAGKSKPLATNQRQFNYELNYGELDLRKTPELYRIGVGEQGVLLVEPYKSEILPFWKFKTPELAKKSSDEILKLFRRYRRQKDLIGMDMARKFLQMGFTRSRRYANHASGRKYDQSGAVLPFKNDAVKAQSAEIFKLAWKLAESDPLYAAMKIAWKIQHG